MSLTACHVAGMGMRLSASGVTCGQPHLGQYLRRPPLGYGYLQMARFGHDRGPAGQGRFRWPLADGGMPISQLNNAGRAEAGS